MRDLRREIGGKIDDMNSFKWTPEARPDFNLVHFVS